MFLIICSCKKLVESPPPVNVVTQANVYLTDATAIAVLNDIYTGLNSGSFQGLSGISIYSGLSSDELSLYSATFSNHMVYYNNALSASNGTEAGSEFWSPFYTTIFKCNAAIEGLSSDQAKSLTASVRKQLMGEAKFMRAFFYFYLANFFGDLPLVKSTDPQINSLLARSPKAAVYEQIVADLKDAESLLNENYLDGTLLSASKERIRPIKWAAKALIARVYLYTAEYAKAESASNEVISNITLFGPLPALNDVFLKNSREAIWQVQPTETGFNTTEARTFVLPDFGPNSYENPVYLSKNLLNSFEPGDERAVNGNWINSMTIGNATYYFPFKYKLNQYDPSIDSYSGSQNMQEYFMVLRLGEQYLIRAEARARLGNLPGAIDDLDKIRGRAGLPLIANTDPGISPSALIDKILHERQVEFFTEWGHRWFDLKRTGKVDAVMSVVTPQKAGGATWKSYQQLYPLPLADIQKDKNLVQNPGY